jgi:hypothetical protein
MPRRKKQQPRDVQFLDEKDMWRILSPLAEKAYDIIFEVIERYIDNAMKTYIQDKVNWKEADETIHNQIKWLLNFKTFLQKYKENIKKI